MYFVLSKNAHHCFDVTHEINLYMALNMQVRLFILVDTRSYDDI